MSKNEQDGKLDLIFPIILFTAFMTMAGDVLIGSGSSHLETNANERSTRIRHMMISYYL